MRVFLKILKILSKILNVFFVILGVIFAILIGVAIWFYIADPLNLRPIIEPLFFGEKNISGNLDANQNPYLTGQQEQILNSIGVNFEDLPSEITPQMETCFIEKLGIERIKEIETNGMPSIADFLKVKSCLSN